MARQEVGQDVGTSSVEDHTTVTGAEIEDDNLDPIEERKEMIEDLFEKAETYAKTNIELFRLKAADKMAVVVASLVSTIVIFLFFTIFFLMLNIGVAIWLGEIMGHVYSGFFIVSGLYLLIALIIYFTRDKLIKNPIIDSIISQILK
ncbi:MAG: phage holin family protein [Saprospiraceae bacterium]